LNEARRSNAARFFRTCDDVASCAKIYTFFANFFGRHEALRAKALKRCQ